MRREKEKRNVPLSDNQELSTLSHNMSFTLGVNSSTEVDEFRRKVSVPFPSPFFTTLSVLCIILNVNCRTKMGEFWECG